MSKMVISVENVSKSYQLGEIGTGTFVGDLRRWWARQRGKPDPYLKIGQADHGNRQSETIWALRDVNFQVQQGEALGIIGRNGAGKTTILKILSRVTAPTRGEVKLNGRIASLLEVGTGFHPELTGRENIYLNGSIYGMTKSEVRRKLDEIVDFSGVEQFIDTPVKRYSSGMYVRLAFAVAAHLDPEILVVDEVLAVGDAAFQEKCLDKMGDAAHGGRTVLFVSHNMGAIQSLCQRVIWLDQGIIVQDGNTSHIVSAYLNSNTSAVAGQKAWPPEMRPGNSSFRLCSVSVRDASGKISPQINISEEILIEIEYEVIREGAQAQFSLVLFDAKGICVFSSLSNTVENAYHGKLLSKGYYRTMCRLYENLLNEDRYRVSIIGTSGYWSDDFRADYVLTFDTLDDGVLKRDYSGRYDGVIRPKLAWQTIPMQHPSDYVIG